MKHVMLLISALMLNSKEVWAQSRQQDDSIKSIDLEEIIIQATRATQTTPITQKTISKQEIDNIYAVLDLKF